MKTNITQTHGCTYTIANQRDLNEMGKQKNQNTTIFCMKLKHQIDYDWITNVAKIVCVVWGASLSVCLCGAKCDYMSAQRKLDSPLNFQMNNNSPQ